MKKIITKLLFLCFVCVLLVSCGKVYNVGDIGPAGGYIFYDCDADNNVEYADLESGEIKKNKDGLTSAECGWRYLEAAPEDLSYKDSSGSTVNYYPFGYYRTSSSGSDLTVGTKTAIGTGKVNTEALVEAMGVYAYTEYNGSAEGPYAAKLCADYTWNEYNDWFLPSSDELNLMYVNLAKQGLGSFADDYYWSSSEDGYSHAWLQLFYNGNQYGDPRYRNYCVRPIRAFK